MYFKKSIVGQKGKEREKKKINRKMIRGAVRVKKE